MGLFLFFSWALVTIGAVTLIWPVNVPLAALAYKIRNGSGPNPLADEGFWWRSTFAALGLAGAGPGTVWLQAVECLGDRQRSAALANAGPTLHEQGRRQRVAAHGTRQQRQQTAVADDGTKGHKDRLDPDQ